MYAQHAPLMMTTLEAALKGKLRDNAFPAVGAPSGRPQEVSATRPRHGLETAMRRILCTVGTVAISLSRLVSMSGRCCRLFSLEMFFHVFVARCICVSRGSLVDSWRNAVMSPKSNRHVGHSYLVKMVKGTFRGALKNCTEINRWMTAPFPCVLRRHPRLLSLTISALCVSHASYCVRLSCLWWEELRTRKRARLRS